MVAHSIAYYEEVIASQKLIIEDQRKKLQFLGYLGNTLRNKALPLNLRLATIAVKELTETATPDENGYYRAYLPRLADTVGVSDSTMSRGLRNLAEYTSAIEHHPVTDEKQPEKTLVFIRPTDLLDTPQDIQPSQDMKRHGGNRRIPCPACGCVHRKVIRREECADCGYFFYESERVYNACPDEQESEPLQDETGSIIDQDPVTEVEPLQDETAPFSDMPEVEEQPPLQDETEAPNEPTRCNLQSFTSTASQCNMPALDELRCKMQWVCWRYETRKGKRTKVPYDPKVTNRAKRAETDNPTTWGTYEQAKAMEHKFDGIGFVFNNDFTGLDADRNKETGELDQQAVTRLERIVSYGEYSPNNGIHKIARGTIPQGRKRNGIEMYCAGRFFTITGNHIEETPLEILDCQAELTALYEELTNTSQRVKTERGRQEVDGSLTDNEVLDKALMAFNGMKFKKVWRGETDGYESQSEADMALCGSLADWTNDADVIDRLFRRSGLYREEKWDRAARSGETYGQGTIRIVLEERQEEAPTRSRDLIPECPDCHTVINVGWDGKHWWHYTCKKLLDWQVAS
jgi:hypothetical protein